MVALSSVVSLAAFIALVGGMLALDGCGAPGSFELCLNTCEASRRCGALSDDAAATCKKNCDAMKGAYSDQDRASDELCKNGPEIRQKTADCLGKECNKIQDCLADVPGCLSK
jgi:hypothetical protein